jgi:hypothetical protein
VMARLAAALTPPRRAEDVAEILALVDGSTAMARQLGDAHALLHVLQFAAAAVGFMVPEEVRLGLWQETVALAMALDQRTVLINTLGGYVTSLLSLGRRADAEAALASYEELLREFPQPRYQMGLPLVRGLLAALAGNLAGFERQSAQVRRLAEAAGGQSALRSWVFQRFAVAQLLGKPELVAADLALLLQHFATSAISMGPFAAWMLAGVGRTDEARHMLDSSPVDPRNFVAVYGAAECCLLLRQPDRAAHLYAGLCGAGGRMFWSVAAGTILGPVARTLGGLALLLGRTDEAAAHLDAAIAFSNRMGAPALVESCRSARATGMPSAGPPTTAPSARPVELVREGDVWAVRSSSGGVFRLKHGKGLQYLRYLLDQPAREVHVLELVGSEHQAGDAGPVLDAQAKASYRERLDELRDELEEAERFADAGRISRAQAEIEAIAAQLAGAVGLGGRDRRAASDVERARINVQRRLKDAIDRIGETDEALGHFLSLTIKTGIYCVFVPLAGHGTARAPAH